MIWIMGGGGFLGSSIAKSLIGNGISTQVIDRSKSDFNNIKDLKELVKKIGIFDTIIFLVGIVPCKNQDQLILNTKMLENFLDLLPIYFEGTFVYISSDAVYSNSLDPIEENSPKNPNSIHGVMHLTREKMVLNRFSKSYIIVRPSLIYGNRDTHNSYGPNRFIRQIQSCQPISIIGQGEELRDHVYVEEVSHSIKKLIFKNSWGIYNISSGKVLSFKEVAGEVINFFKCAKLETRILYSKRVNPIIEDPIRAVSNSKIRITIPELVFDSMKNNFRKEFPIL